MAGLRRHGWRIAVLVGLIGAPACETVRLRAPIDLGGYASGVALTREIGTPPPIVRLRVPEGWNADSPRMNPGIIDDGPVYDRDAFELSIPEVVFSAPTFEYAGAIYFQGASEGMDIDRIRRHEVRAGFAQNIDNPSLSRTRIDGRDAFILQGDYDLGQANLSSRHDPRAAIRRGDIAMAIIPLRQMGTNVVVVLISRPGVLSRDPALALAILGTCRFREPSRRGDTARHHAGGHVPSARAPIASIRLPVTPGRTSAR